MKKIWRFLGSMGFAIGLLVVLAAACVGASFVTQGQSAAWYEQVYGAGAARLILGTGLDDAFHSWWFLTLTAFLCGNLLLCNLTRLKPLIARTRREADPAAALAGPCAAGKTAVFGASVKALLSQFLPSRTVRGQSPSPPAL